MNSPKHLVAILDQPIPKKMNRETQYTIYQTITQKFARELNVGNHNILHQKSYPSRNSFGDMDIFVPDTVVTKDFPDTVRWAEKVARVVFQNGNFALVPGTNTVVFNYGGYQINFHIVPADELAYTYSYYRYEGFYSLVSILFNNLGLKYTPKGLFIKNPDETQPDILITNSHQHVERLAGLSADTLAYGIHNESDSFVLISRSRYFNQENFLKFAEENPSVIEASPIVKNFTDWLKKNSSVNRAFTPDSSDATNWVVSFKREYPFVYAEIKKGHEESKFADLIKFKYNSELIHKITGLTTEKLGYVFENFPKSFKSLKHFEVFIASSSPETIEGALLKYSEQLMQDVSAPQVEISATVPVVEVKPVEPSLEPPKLEKAKKVKKVAKTSDAPELKPKKKTVKKVTTLPPVTLPSIPEVVA
jgi:hypothetical protein